MKRNLYILILTFLFMGLNYFQAYAQTTGSAQGPGASLNNVPGAADESLVQGNGTQPGQNHTGANVNTFTGDVEATATDFNYSRYGFPLKYERYFHNGITSPFAELGQGWMSNYDICLYVPMPNSSGDHALLVTPHQVWRFSTSDGGNTFTAPAGCFYRLQNVSGTYVLIDKSGMIMKFQVLAGGEPNIARLIEMDDLNGNKVTLSYGTCILFNEHYETTWNTNHPNTCGSGTNPSNATYDWYSSYQTLRLTTVTGPNSNWTINFNYYDNNSWVQQINQHTCVGDNPCWFPDFSPLECCVVSYNPDTGCVLYNLVWYFWTNTNSFGNRLQSVTNSVGDTITFDSGGQSGPITQVTRSPNSLNASYQYYSYVVNPTSNATTVVTLNKIVDPLAPAGYRNLTYTSENNSTSINNPVRQIINALGQVMYSYDYSTDGSGNKVTSTSGPNGLIESDSYNPQGLFTQKRFVIDGHPYVESYTFNSNFLPTNIIDGNGNPTTMAYDSLGNMIFSQDAEGYSKRAVYDNNIQYSTTVNGSAWSYNYSRLISSSDKNQVNRNYVYDGNGNLIRLYEPGRRTAYTYDSYGNKTSMTDGNNHTTLFTYDSNGNPSSVQEPAIGPPENLSGAITSYFYNSRSQPVTITDALNQSTVYIYNAKNFPVTIQYPDGTNENYFYDNDADKIQITDRKGTTSTFAYDLADRLTDSYQGGTKHTQIQLDAIGNPIALIDNKNQKTIFIYNEQNKIRSTSDPVGVGYSNVYDGVLNLLTSRDTRGVTKTMTYYKNNRLKSAQFSDGTPSISYTYDGNGNRKSMTDGVGLKIYSYDSLNNLQSVTDTARNFNLTYTYDAVGNKLTEQNNKISGTIQCSYYENNLLKILTDTEGMATTYIYDKLKNPNTISYPNGAIAAYFFDYTNHTNRLTALQTINSKQEVISSFSYVYDAVGNPTTITNLTGSTTFGYDNLYQLANATYPGPQSIVSYNYDGVGNRITLTKNGVPQNYTYDSGNQLSSTSGPNGESFSYDAVGNMKTRSSGYTYTWDALNRLVKTTIPSGTVTFVYDGDDRRVQKISPNGTTNYFYDGNSVILETDGNGNNLKIFNFNICFKDQKGTKLFYLFNGHGDSVGLMDIFQNIVSSYSYDVFGKTWGNNRDNSNRRYVGSLGVYSDDDIGLEYMYHRWYDPNLGRFISRDPIGLQGGLNLYDYCNNNPCSLIDPNGKDPFILIPIIIGAIAGGIAAGEATHGDLKAVITGVLVGGALGYLLAPISYSTLTALSSSAITVANVMNAAVNIGLDFAVTAGLSNLTVQTIFSLRDVINNNFNFDKFKINFSELALVSGGAYLVIACPLACLDPKAFNDLIRDFGQKDVKQSPPGDDWK